MNIKERIRILAKKHGMSLPALEAELGLGNSTISKWANSAPNTDNLNRVATYFGVTLDYLVNGVTSSITSSDGNAGIWIPVLGRVTSNIPINMVTDIIDMEQITEEMAASGEYFALQIHEDSMAPRMKDGDVVIVRQQDYAESGEIVIATINGDDATCKRLRKYAEGIMLLSTNPAYEPMTFNIHDIEELPVKILGKVVELRATF